jgi:4'-phosphopantetheinyl transferase
VWNQPPAALQLAAGEVHVWRADLSELASRLAALGDLLSDDERARAGRFRFARDHDRFVVTRGLLRELLHRYLDVPPARLLFRYGSHGKPALAPPLGGGLRFNVSHSHDLALFAFCREHDLGVDVEHIRADIECDQLARHFFSPLEVAALLALPAGARVEAFFRCWTLKEAYLKAHGEGLSVPLDQFDVAFAPGTPPALLATRSDPADAARWTLATLDPGACYAAALAVERPITSIQCWLA